MVDGAPAHACRPVPSEPEGWQPAQPAGPNALTGVVATAAGTLFAIDDHAERLFRSDDEGQTWCYLATPAPPSKVFLSSDPARTLYLTVVEPTVGAPGGPAGSARVFRSDDGGDTWIDPGGRLPGPLPQLFPASEEPREVFAITEGLWATHDGGEHWEGLVSEPRWGWIARHPVRKQEIYGLVTNDPSTTIASYILVMSSDEGRTWSEVKAAAGTPVLSPRFESDGSLLAIDQAGQLRVLGVDGSWTTRGRPAPLGARFILGERARPPALYVGTGAAGNPIKVWKSADEGDTWNLVYSSNPTGVAVWPLPSGRLLESGPIGLRVSSDDGQTWRTLRGFVQGPSLTSTAAGTGALFLYGSYAFSRSDDQGATWSTVPFRDDRRIVRLIPDPTVSDSYFALVAPRSSVQTHVARSRDAGKTWTDLAGLASVPDVLDLAVLPTSPPTLLAAVSPVGVLRSEDDGLTWTATTGVTEPLARNFGATVIRPAPSKPTQVYALLSTKLHLSTDGGRTWMKLLPDAAIDAISVDPSDENTFYFRKGFTAELFKYSGSVRQLPLQARSFLMTAARPGVLYFTDAATDRLARTADEGKTVTLLDIPAPVRRLMFDPRQPDLLYTVVAELAKKVVE
jgi:photosystem II stability/assembly factor-like uncharacterized protein